MHNKDYSKVTIMLFPKRETSRKDKRSPNRILLFVPYVPCNDYKSIREVQCVPCILSN